MGYNAVEQPQIIIFFLELQLSVSLTAGILFGEMLVWETGEDWYQVVSLRKSLSV